MAAVIVEPVLGEGGFVVPPPEYLRRLKQICEEHGIVFVCDEIQTGIRPHRQAASPSSTAAWCPTSLPRPSRWARAIPWPAVTGRAEIMDSPPPGAIGGTYGGNPVACAAALAVFDIIEEEELLRAGRGHRQAACARASTSLQARYPGGGRRARPGGHDGHGVGGGPRDQAAGRRAGQGGANGAFERGVLCLLAGAGDNVVRVLVPLTIEDEVLERGLSAIEASLEAAVARRV